MVGRLGEDVAKQRFQFALLLARGCVDDDGPLTSGSLDLTHAKPVPLQSPPDLRIALLSIAMDTRQASIAALSAKGRQMLSIMKSLLPALPDESST